MAEPKEQGVKSQLAGANWGPEKKFWVSNAFAQSQSFSRSVPLSQLSKGLAEMDEEQLAENEP